MITPKITYLFFTGLDLFLLEINQYISDKLAALATDVGVTYLLKLGAMVVIS